MNKSAQDSAATPKSKPKVGDVIFFSLFFAITGAVLLAYFTNPSEAEMRKTLDGKLTEGHSGFRNFLTYTTLSILDVQFHYHDYWLFSTMTVHYKDKSARILWGCFGHVGTSDLPAHE